MIFKTRPTPSLPVSLQLSKRKTPLHTATAWKTGLLPLPSPPTGRVIFLGGVGHQPSSSHSQIPIVETSNLGRGYLQPSPHWQDGGSTLGPNCSWGGKTGHLPLPTSVQLLKWGCHSERGAPLFLPPSPELKELSWTLTSYHKQNLTQNGSKTKVKELRM